MFGDLKNYINKRITLTKYEIVDFTSNMLAGGLYVLIIAVSVMFLVLLGSIAFGFILGRYFNNYGYGFLAITGIYFLFILLFVIFRKRVKLFLTNIAVESAMSALSNHEDED
jgi:hypothetical protein